MHVKITPKRRVISVCVILAFFVFFAVDLVKIQIIDGKKYDLDGEFCHDDETATGALCAIDCLVGDIEDDYQTVLKNVEKIPKNQ